MGREYDIKDVLLEAGTRDYADMENAEWTPSDKHAEFMDKMFGKKKKKTPDTGNISKLIKACVATAAAAAVVCLCLAVRPLREAISSAAGNLFGVS